MPENTALYPGSFDCLTYGHLNLIERCARLFGRVVVAVAVNAGKNPTFSIMERIEMLSEETAQWDNVEVIAFEGLTVHYAKKHNLRFIIRGLRAVSDFEYELQMALMNQKIEPAVETIFMTPTHEFVFVSSTLAKEIILNGGNISSIVPPGVERRLRDKMNKAHKKEEGRGE